MTDELRKLLAAWQATEEAHEHAHSAQDAYIEALVDAAPGLFDDRDKLAALTAERDAAVAALNMKPHERNSHALGIMEGERRGSAKAVVFMKREYAMDGWDVVNAIEHGDHLTQP